MPPRVVLVALVLCLLAPASAPAQDATERVERLVAEAWERRPGGSTYGELMILDAQHGRRIDPDWAAKVGTLLGARYQLHHGAHFSLLTDVEDLAKVNQQVQTMEQAYRSYYLEMLKLGLRPLPPRGRLLCVLNQRESDYRDFMRRFEGEESEWSAGSYSWRTNRTAFFLDSDHEVFREAQRLLDEMAGRIETLRRELADGASGDTRRRLQLQDALRRTSWQHRSLQRRLDDVAGQASSATMRHEVTHQLLFNSGVQKRGHGYPFWLSEGLACLFEDPVGGGPRGVNRMRLERYRRLDEERRLRTVGDVLAGAAPREFEDLADVASDYAQAWALCHFLWNKYPAGMRGFLQEVSDGRAIRDWHSLFARHFTDDFKRLDHELARHVEGLTEVRLAGER